MFVEAPSCAEVTLLLIQMTYTIHEILSQSDVYDIHMYMTNPYTSAKMLLLLRLRLVAGLMSES